jgi:hypothetical protein
VILDKRLTQFKPIVRARYTGNLYYATTATTSLGCGNHVLWGANFVLGYIAVPRRLIRLASRARAQAVVIWYIALGHRQCSFCLAINRLYLSGT